MKGVLAYKVESRPVGDTRTMRPHAVAVCGSCDGEFALAMPGHGNNPEAIGERFRRDGFEFNPFKRASVRCPGCIERAKRVRSGPSNPKVVPMSSSRPTLVASPPGGVSPSSGVTPEQRAKVRDLLTGTFDEQRGHYLDNYSDQRVAKECDVPMLVVREMREMWLGPIKTVPELEALQAELRALGERADRHAAEGLLINQAIGLLTKRLEETRRQLGVAA